MNDTVRSHASLLGVGGGCGVELAGRAQRELRAVRAMAVRNVERLARDLQERKQQLCLNL